jgi:hypothetical protein
MFLLSLSQSAFFLRPVCVADDDVSERTQTLSPIKTNVEREMKASGRVIISACITLALSERRALCPSAFLLLLLGGSCALHLISQARCIQRRTRQTKAARDAVYRARKS